MSTQRVIRTHPLFIGLLLVPVTLLLAYALPDATTLLFFFSLLAIMPLAALLSHSTEHLAEYLGNNRGGLLSASMGNMTELIVGLTALHAGMYDLVKAALAGAVISNGLFTLGLSFLLGGFRHHLQQLNLDYVHMQAGLLLLATIALLVPSFLPVLPSPNAIQAIQPISLVLSLILMFVYLLSLYFTLSTHPEIFSSKPKMPPRGFNGRPPSHYVIAMILATVGIALVSELFVDSLSAAATHLKLSQAFIGFILVALAGGAAEMYSAVHAARGNRPELSLAIALGSSTQISLLVAPLLVLLSYVVAPMPMNLQFSAVAVLMILLSTLSLVTIMSSRYTTWYTGVLLLAIYAIFSLTLFFVPIAT